MPTDREWGEVEEDLAKLQRRVESLEEAVVSLQRVVESLLHANVALLEAQTPEPPPPPTTNLTFHTALVSLKAGRSIRRAAWPAWRKLEWHPENLPHLTVSEEGKLRTWPNNRDAREKAETGAVDWEIAG